MFRNLEEGEALKRQVCNSDSDDRKGYTAGHVMAAAHVWPRLDTLPTKHGCHDTRRDASTTLNRQVKSVATSPAPPPPPRRSGRSSSSNNNGTVVGGWHTYAVAGVEIVGGGATQGT